MQIEVKKEKVECRIKWRKRKLKAEWIEGRESWMKNGMKGELNAEWDIGMGSWMQKEMKQGCYSEWNMGKKSWMQNKYKGRVECRKEWSPEGKVACRMKRRKNMGHEYEDACWDRGDSRYKGKEE